MTAKRFTLVDDYLIEYDGDYFDLHKPSDIRSLITTIGYVTDENEQLKDSLMSWSKSYKRLSEENDVLRIKIRKLRLEKIHQNKENEQLRHQIETYKSGNALLNKTLDKEWK